MSTTSLRAEIEDAVDAYQRVFPPPYRLAPNLELAVAALAELDRAEAQIAALRDGHHAPAPDRGVQCVHFIGGAQDGGQGIVATEGRDLDQAVLSIDGTNYRITSVRTTCYTAEAES